MPIPPDAQEYLEDFKESLRSIKAAVRAQKEVIPKAIADQTAALTDILTGKDFASHATPGPSYAGGRSGGSTLDDIDDAALRARLNAHDRDPYGGRVRDLGSDWRDRVNMRGADSNLSWLHFPGAHMTPVDYFDTIAVSAANLAARRQASAAKQSDLYDTAQSLGLVSDTGEMHPDVASALAGSDSRLGGLSNLAAGAQSGYITGQKIKGMLGDVFLKPARAMQNSAQYAYQTGYTGSDSPGFLGLRMPWDGAVAQGFGQRLSQVGFALNNSLTPSQAGTIYSNLFGQGWLGGSQTNHMRDAAAQIMRSNSYIGSQPQTYSMMDQATRMGVTSLQRFVDTMSQVPDAAKAAHTSLGQTMTDMQAIGEVVKQQGGNVQGGYDLTNAWQRVTGLPGATLTPALTNPMVMAQTYMNTGLMPMEQGLASPGQRIAAIMQTVSRMHNTIIPQGAKNYNLGDGFHSSVSGEDQRVALMAQFFPGWSSNTIKKMLHNRQAITTGSNLQGHFDAWNQSMQGAGDDRAKLSHLLSAAGGGHGNWGDLVHEMHGARYIGQSGRLRKMFTDKQIQGLQGIRADDIEKWVTDHPGANQTHGGRTGVSAGVADRAMLDGRQTLPAELQRKIVHDRIQAAGKIMSQNTSKQSNPGKTVVQIQLTGAAQKALSFSSPTGQGKAQGNAGSININVPYAGGYTQPPMPDLNTASPSQSYGPGFPPGSPGSSQ